MTNFQPGDVVRLKSGGPKMTVQDSPEAAHKTTCQWFDRNGKVHTDHFDRVMLEVFVSRSHD